MSCPAGLATPAPFAAPLAAACLQEKLQRMLATIQAMWLMCWRLTQLHEAGAMTHEQASLVKAWTTLRSREVLALGRELLGGNGILSDFLVAKAFCDAEAYYRCGGGRPPALLALRALPPSAAVPCWHADAARLPACTHQQPHFMRSHGAAAAVGCVPCACRRVRVLSAAAAMRAPTRSMRWWRAAARPASAPSSRLARASRRGCRRERRPLVAPPPPRPIHPSSAFSPQLVCITRRRGIDSRGGSAPVEPVCVTPGQT